jgi:hypothetical protein
MKFMRVVLHSVALALADLAGIIVGFLAFKILGSADQILVQLPVAVMATIGGVVAWSVALRALRFPRLLWTSESEAMQSFLISLTWGPLLFVPLHFFTQGYVTSLRNLVVLAAYQVPVNLLAVAAAWHFQCRRAPQSR